MGNVGKLIRILTDMNNKSSYEDYICALQESYSKYNELIKLMENKNVTVQ